MPPFKVSEKCIFHDLKIREIAIVTLSELTVIV